MVFTICDLCLNNIIVSSELKFKDGTKLTTASNAQGTAGTNGSQGSTGSQGTTGNTGSKGSQGTKGDAGALGPQGESVSSGYCGSTGAGKMVLLDNGAQGKQVQLVAKEQQVIQDQRVVGTRMQEH